VSHIRMSCVTLSMSLDEVVQEVLCCSVLQCAAVCCSMLQRVAMCCSVLPCVAVCGVTNDNESHKFAHTNSSEILGCSALQCVAVCCSVLQCVAVCCSVFVGSLMSVAYG